MKLYVNEFWSGFLDKTNPVHIGFFQELFGKVFQENIEIGETIEESDILLETIFSSTTNLFDKKWKYTFLFSGESRLNQYAEHYSCILYGERNHDNIINVPLFIPYLYCNHFIEKIDSFNENSSSQIPPKNICVVISNPEGSQRNHFLEKLEQKIPIDYLGNYKNNAPKLDYVYNTEEFRNRIKEYKCIISMENSTGDTYITEKITHGFLSGIIPIYWGSPRISDYFNENRFINIESMDEEYLNKKIERIIEICNNENEYLKIVSEQVFKNKKLFRQIDDIVKDIRNLIFEKPYPLVQQIYTISNNEFEPDRFSHMSDLFFNKLKLNNDNIKFICPTYKHTITDEMMKELVKEELVLKLRDIKMKKSEVSLCLNYKAVLEDIEKNYKDGMFIIFESDIFILDISLFDDFLEIANKNREKWDLIHFGNEGLERLFTTPHNPVPTPYRDRLTDYSEEFIEDITNENNKIRLVRKYSSRCTDSFLWNYSGVVKFLKYMNETPYNAPFDYYMYNYFEIDNSFKHYWTSINFFLQGSNVGYLQSKIQKDIN